jgi:hypothetical protein
MYEYSSVLNEIVKAKENIKRKLFALKNGEANFESLVAHTLKPLIEPLTEISKKNNNLDINPSIQKNTYKKEDQTYDSANNIPDEDQTYDSANSITEKDQIYDSAKANIVPDEEQFIKLNISNWFDSSNLDRIYGPKQFFNDIKLGIKDVKFNGNTLIIEDNSYWLTPGLEQLIFSKNPTLYNDFDFQIYKRILSQTSAHLTIDGSRIKKGGTKYEHIITKLFPSGGGMTYGGLKLQKNNFVYWDNPNELVDRLRLLLASQAAGNTSLSNEILSIFEELYEAGIIKRIPNV